jgi:hypothetical protein
MHCKVSWRRQGLSSIQVFLPGCSCGSVLVVRLSISLLEFRLQSE